MNNLPNIENTNNVRAVNLPIPMMEFFFDTTRTVTNMILNGTLKRFPDIKIVIPHAGAFLSILADKIAPVLLFGRGEKEKIDVTRK